MAHKHTNKKGQEYYLHGKSITLRGSGKEQTIYFFAREVRAEALDEVPKGYKVVENPRTGLPVLKRS